MPLCSANLIGHRTLDRVEGMLELEICVNFAVKTDECCTIIQKHEMTDNWVVSYG